MWSQVFGALLAIALFGCAQKAEDTAGDARHSPSDDRDYLPVVKIAPEYPADMREQGVEGHVILEYTVNEKGRVEDIVVIESEPEGAFDQAAIDAARQFEYEPRYVDGESIRVEGVRNVFRFTLRQPTE